MRLWPLNHLVIWRCHTLQRHRSKFTLYHAHDQFYEHDCRFQGSLIPAGEDVEAFNVNDTVAWVLLVEKEVFWHKTPATKNMHAHHDILISGSFPNTLSPPDLYKPLYIRSRNHDNSESNVSSCGVHFFIIYIGEGVPRCCN